MAPLCKFKKAFTSHVLIFHIFENLFLKLFMKKLIKILEVDNTNNGKADFEVMQNLIIITQRNSTREENSLKDMKKKNFENT